MKKLRSCQLCGSKKNVLHQIWPPNEEKPSWYCCKCYVDGGNPPANWHPECMRTYKNRSKYIEESK